MKHGETKAYAVVAVEYGDSVDGKGRVIALFRARSEAKAYMESDAKDFAEGLELTYEVFDDSATAGDTECGCEYLIQELDFGTLAIDGI